MSAFGRTAGPPTLSIFGLLTLVNPSLLLVPVSWLAATAGGTDRCGATGAAGGVTRVVGGPTTPAASTTRTMTDAPVIGVVRETVKLPCESVKPVPAGVVRSALSKTS